jgi:hypothetical protein
MRRWIENLAAERKSLREIAATGFVVLKGGVQAGMRRRRMSRPSDPIAQTPIVAGSGTATALVTPV